MIQKQTIELLKKQREEKFKFIGADKTALTKELLDNIGVEDPEIRDGLIYPCLAHLLHDKHFSATQLKSFMDILFDNNHLFFDLDNTIKNSVLTRSFSSLQISILLYVDQRDQLFDEMYIKSCLESYLDYFNKETHYEGYNDEVGFLHSIAHAADVFHQFLTIEYFTDVEIKKIFNAISEKMKSRDYYFSHDEDERMVVGISKAIRRNILSKEYLIDWLSAFSIYEKDRRYPEMYNITNNVKNVLRSLYFSFIYDEEYNDITNEIKKLLKKNVSLR